MARYALKKVQEHLPVRSKKPSQNLCPQRRMLGLGHSPPNN